MQRRSRSSWVIVPVILGAALVIAACGGGDDEEATATAEAQAQATAEAQAQATAEAQAQATAEAQAQATATASALVEEAVASVPEELGRFFAGLPAAVKAELEAAGWSEERIAAFITAFGESQQLPPLEELRRLLEPLADIPIGPLRVSTAVALGQLPAAFSQPLVTAIGQQAFDELKSRERAPTGSELLAFLELLSALGLL